jgi:ketosteroid isomerase-like protein
MSTADPADFVARFASFWSAPAPDRLGDVLAEDVRLVTPMTPDSTTLEGARRSFAEIFELITDMTGTVRRWSPTDDGVLIELTLSGRVGGQPVSLNAIDRVVIGEDGRATERISYFDPTPLVLTALRRPRSWPRFARTQLRRLRDRAVN